MHGGRLSWESYRIIATRQVSWRITFKMSFFASPTDSKIYKSAVIVVDIKVTIEIVALSW